MNRRLFSITARAVRYRSPATAGDGQALRQGLPVSLTVEFAETARRRLSALPGTRRR
ncbi:hypothetical protein ACF044_18700 [Microbacterium sp. NPDC016588]|uniref:Uncharacterized protein n=1 Tax=Streptomyces rimosus subsp. rimosus TaxID=132474 RepID=A0ABY3YT88_STRRM|nr:hypothetical protein SRIMR7_03625 [Streptomyces rimosus subsp. rimosus]